MYIQFSLIDALVHSDNEGLKLRNVGPKKILSFSFRHRKIPSPSARAHLITFALEKHRKKRRGWLSGESARKTRAARFFEFSGRGTEAGRLPLCIQAF